MGTHPLEVLFACVASVATLTTGFLFTVKLADLIRVKRQGVNGPIVFMTWDNIRHQCFMFGMASGMCGLAISSLNNPVPPSPQALNFITGAVVFAVAITADSSFRYRRRRRLAELVAEYERQESIEPLPGGKRKYDPPLSGV